MSLRHGWAAAFMLACCATVACADGPLEVSVQVGTGGCAAGTCATGSCATGCCGWWGHCCCPKICFPLEKPPRIKFKCICPKPVCEPCDLAGLRLLRHLLAPVALPAELRLLPRPAAARSRIRRGAADRRPPRPGVARRLPDESLPAPKKAANPNPDR